MRSSSRVEATVVVPCLNGGRVLGACLAALDGQTVRDSLRVIVADGGSIDDSVARARRGRRRRGDHDRSGDLGASKCRARSHDDAVLSRPRRGLRAVADVGGAADRGTPWRTG